MRNWDKTKEGKKWRKEYHKRWYQKNKEKVIQQQKEYYQNNKEKISVRKRLYDKKWYQRFRKRKIKQAVIYQRKRRKTDIKFRLDGDIKTIICRALRGRKKGQSWEKIVGYTLEDLIKHLEAQFDKNMSWNNYGSYWHIDHIKPKCLFSIEEVKECWALSNLQPLEAKENLKKSNRYF